MLSPVPRSTPVSRLGDRLAAARRKGFVGRRVEIDTFRRVLTDPDLPLAVLLLYGPGGIGKTTLLGEFAQIAAENNAHVVHLDGRNLEPSPPGFLLALGQELGSQDGTSSLEALNALSQVVLIIDTFEVLNPIEGWLRDTFLPHVSDHVLVVLAGRNPPAVEWRTNPGWSDLVRVISVRNFLPEECQTYLDARNISGDQRESVLRFTHGHPLALSLVADVLAQGDDLTQFDPEQHPDLVKPLLDRFASQVPSPLHREALQVCAHMRVTTEALLDVALDTGDTHEIFEWLRGLSFIEQGRDGLFPHDLARDVLDTDLRWRSPEHYVELHRRVRVHITRRLQEASGAEQQRAFYDLIFMHRTPMMRMFHDLGSQGTVYFDRATAEDFPHILDMVRKHEGEESASIAEYWLNRQPQAFAAFRNIGGELLGFSTNLLLQQMTSEDREIDPGIDAAWTFAQRHGPIRPGEELLYHRFQMAQDTYQQPSPVFDMVGMRVVTHWLTNPRTAWSFLATGEADLWYPMFTYLNQQRSPDADFTIGGRKYEVFTHDWRAESGAAWMDIMGERELEENPNVEPFQTPAVAPIVVLSQPEFEDAVRRALRDFARPAALAGNVLLRSRLVIDYPGAARDADALRELIRTAANTLRAHPKDERLYRAVHHTYLQPAGTQELAAELLDLPFSTYRYHLTAGIKRITDWLWQREINGPEG